MTLSIAELSFAREASASLLEELGLDAYLFEIEPGDKMWELTVECAMSTNGAWETIRLQVPIQMLLASQDDAALRDQMLAELSRRFRTCRRRGKGK